MVKTIACTHCNAPLPIRNPRSKTVVCAHCGAQLDLTSKDYDFLGTAIEPKLRQPLRVGLRCSYDGTEWEIVGHLRLHERTWFWDEYLLLGGDGRTHWIEYDGGRFYRNVPFTPSSLEPVDRNSLVVTVDGKTYGVRERGSAYVMALSGEFTWKVRRNDPVDYLDCNGLAVEITPNEIEVFRVQPLSAREVAEMFALGADELAAGCYLLHEEDDDEGDDEGDDDDDPFTHTIGSGRHGGNVILFAFVLLVLIFAFGSCVGCWSTSGSYGDGGTYYGGGRSSWGGGGSFGGK